jgi:hypothetical protein
MSALPQLDDIIRIANMYSSTSDAFTKREAAQESLYIREKELEK